MNIEEQIKDILGAITIWEEEAWLIKELTNLLKQQREEAVMKFATEINRWAMNKKEVWGDDNEYFITMDEMHKLLIEYRLTQEEDK